jgi:cobalamin biosynthesis Co2+ chelatase CbiK
MEKIDKIGIGNAKPLLKNTTPVYADDFNKVVESLNSIIDNTPTTDQILALQKANSPSITNPVATINDLIPSKRYHVFLSQVGTNAPTATILSDSITPVLAYSAVGTYTVTKVGAFVSGKTTPNAAGAVYIDMAENKITAEWTSVDVITIKTYAEVDTTVLANDVLSEIDFNIEIFE